MDKIYNILNNIENYISISKEKIDKKNSELNEKSNSDNIFDLVMPPLSEEDKEDSSIVENEELKQELYQMSLASLKAIKAHVAGILDAIDEDKSDVKENLTESWLQGKIAIVADYVRHIHDFLIFSGEADDSINAGSRPGLWDNIRKKKEREGKKYKPAKRGDKDRPDPDTWNKLTKDTKK